VLSQTSEHALRAALYLAREGRDRPVRVDEISEALDIPRNYLSKILHSLGQRGILSSARGPRGGFVLAVPPAGLPLARIVEAFEPQLLSEGNRCLLGQSVCSDRNPCQAHEQWKKVAVPFQEFFRRTTLEELARGSGAPAAG
jgi:Rrf2 family protein